MKTISCFAGLRTKNTPKTTLRTITVKKELTFVILSAIPPQGDLSTPPKLC